MKFALMQLHSAFGDGKPNAETAGFCAASAIHTIERTEDIFSFGLRNSRSTVVDLEHNAIRATCFGVRQADFDSRARFGVSHGITDHILNRPI